MNPDYRIFYEMEQEPFAADIDIKDILVTPSVLAVQERVLYASRLGAVALVTGEIGSGKSTALRYATEKMHPSEYRSFYITATTGSISELYRQFLDALGTSMRGISKAVMQKRIRDELYELVKGKKLNVVLLIDEASLMRLEVFTELHTLCQFEKDSKPYLSIVLAGQGNIVDSLMYRSSMPLCSRIVARSHLEGVSRDQMREYLIHHLSICGVKNNLFDETAMTAIHQGAGGLFRKANHLARGAIIIAAKKKAMAITADHVRMAATEIF